MDYSFRQMNRLTQTSVWSGMVRWTVGPFDGETDDVEMAFAF